MLLRCNEKNILRQAHERRGPKKTALIIQLAATATADLVQVFVALNGAPLDRLTRTHSRATAGAISPAPTALATAAHHAAAHAAILAPPRIPRTVVGTSTIAVAASSAGIAETTPATDGTASTLVTAGGGVPSSWVLYSTSSEHLREVCHVGEAHGEHAVHGEILQVEASWRASRRLAITRREVAVAVSIGSGRSNVSWVYDVCVDELELQGVSVTLP